MSLLALCLSQPDIVLRLDGMAIPAAEHAIYVHRVPPEIVVWTQPLLVSGFED